MSNLHRVTSEPSKKLTRKAHKILSERVSRRTVQAVRSVALRVEVFFDLEERLNGDFVVVVELKEEFVAGVSVHVVHDVHHVADLAAV